MRTQWDLFCKPNNLATAYEEGIADVRKEMNALILKKPPEGRNEDFKAGWNAAIIELSKRIRIEKGKRK